MVLQSMLNDLGIVVDISTLARDSHPLRQNKTPKLKYVHNIVNMTSNQDEIAMYISVVFS